MSSGKPSVTHLLDCADVGRTLVRHGVRAGHNWHYHPGNETVLHNPLAIKARAASWHTRRIAKILRSDLIHLHYGANARVLDWFPRRPHVVHIHGSDISILYQTDPAARDVIQRGLDSAEAVLYSTPDLAEATRSARSDAMYLPNPVETAGLPVWQPATKPTVVFSSRWERRKGSEANLEIAEQVLKATAGRVSVEGLDWGDLDSRERAREIGMQLVPKMSRGDYLNWLSRAHVTVGHQGGILAISEFQSVAIGVPTVMKLGEGYYPEPHPVLQGRTTDELAAQVLLALQDPEAMSRRLGGLDWVRLHHAPAQSVDQLSAVYADILF